MALTDALKNLAGGWKGTTTVWPGPEAEAIHSDVWLDARLAARGKFLIFAYDWAVQNQPQQGELGFSIAGDGESVQGWWIDSWHNDNAVMNLTGETKAENEVFLSGTFAAPDGPDWGWDIQITAETTNLDIVMWVIPPDEAGMIGVRYTLTKST